MMYDYGGMLPSWDGKPSPTGIATSASKLPVGREIGVFIDQNGTIQDLVGNKFVDHLRISSIPDSTPTLPAGDYRQQSAERRWESPLTPRMIQF